MDRYDSIIIGAGHNGLVCAGYLARAGQRVLVLEASDSVGGIASLHEFHPGFRASPVHHASHFATGIATDLELEKHGARPLASPDKLIGLAHDGGHVVVAPASVSGVGEADTEAYADLSALLDRFAAALEPFWGKTIPRIATIPLPKS